MTMDISLTIRQWWSGQSITARRAAKKLGIVMFGFLVVTIAATAIFCWYMPNNESFFNRQNIAGLLVSLWAALFFGLVIGVATTWITSIRPHEDPLDVRVWNLFPRLGDGAAKVYVLERIKKLAALATQGSVRIVVKEYLPADKAYRIEVHTSYTLRNIIPDLSYRDSIQVQVIPDVVDRQELGAVLGIYTIKDRQRDSLLPGNVTQEITIASKEYNQSVTLDIPADGEITYGYEFWIWSKVDVDFRFEVNRYSQNVTISVVNAIPSQRIPLTVIDQFGEARKDSIAPEQGAKFEGKHLRTTALAPDEAFVIKFHIPEAAA